MTANAFATAAKSAVCLTYKKIFGVELNADDLDITHYADLLNNKYGMVYGLPMANQVAEVTYHLGTNEFFVDLYQKIGSVSYPMHVLNYETKHD